MKIISVREQPDKIEIITQYIQQAWKEVSPIIYADCIKHCIDAENPLPQWYILETDNNIVGCAGVITNDFISRMDLYPWLCALYIAEEYRGNNYAKLLIDRAKEDMRLNGFRSLYLSTDHIGYYEKLGFEYIGQGYHPWEEESRIYKIEL